MTFLKMSLTFFMFSEKRVNGPPKLTLNTIIAEEDEVGGHIGKKLSYKATNIEKLSLGKSEVSDESFRTAQSDLSYVDEHNEIDKMDLLIDKDNETDKNRDKKKFDSTKSKKDEFINTKNIIVMIGFTGVQFGVMQFRDNRLETRKDVCFKKYFIRFKL
jgi:hypothetical protein